MEHVIQHVRLLRFFKLLLILIVAVLVLMMMYHCLLPASTLRAPSPLLVCHDVLHNMLRGRWHQHRMTSDETEKLRAFHKRVREEHQIPQGNQRADKRCGNINVGSTGMLVYFKALCDPDGDTPCCYNYTCQNKSVQQCACANCQDLRIPVHAEYATWRPQDPSCQPQNWTVPDLCRLLKNSTIHFIGDSLMRHLFIAFLLKVRGNFETGAFKGDIPDNLRVRCSGLYMFTEKVCRKWVDSVVRACNGSAIIKFFEFYKTQYASDIRSNVLDLHNISRSLVFVGIGLHDDLNAEVIKTKILQPILETKKTRQLTRPHLLWAGVHQFGLMKTPLTKETNEAVRAFNKDIKGFLDVYNVSVFDTYNLTYNVTSFDGTHYGFGVNSMKVDILLHYVQDLVSLGKW